jgi:hypothetical protein
MSHHFKNIELVYCSELTGVLSWGLIGVHVTWEEGQHGLCSLSYQLFANGLIIAN